MIGAVLFTWLQGAGFYRELHQKAVDCLPSGDGKTWIDLGCGPGLLARQAALKHYDVTGIDTDAAMIRAARRIVKWQGSSARFETGDLSYLANRQADVISAASLLAVLPDPQAALATMWNSVLPGGALLIIEPTEQMNPANANRLIESGLPKKRINGLRLWARARQNRAVDDAVFDTINTDNKSSLDLLGGLVSARIFNK